MENQIRGMILGQALALEQDFIVAGTREYITATFQFSPEWDGLSIWAHFDRGNSHWKIHLHEGEILRSDKLNLTHGPWEVSLHGTAVDGMRITTEPVDLSVRRTNIDGDAPLGDAPASPLEQLDQRVTKLEQSGGSGGGTLDHSLLTNREQSDQHPMEAITGLTELRDKINTFFNADDPTLDQLAELIQAIKANQGTIEGLTNGKVSVSDIVNDLTTGGANKVLSAEMGAELKRLIDAVPDWAMSPDKPIYTAKEVGALSQSELQTGVDRALEQAKQSGEFDGKPGKDGTDGKPGMDGKDGTDGKPGTNGSNGGHYTPSISQPSPDTMRIEFTGSLPDMPPVDPATVNLPKGTGKLEPLTFTGASTEVYDGTKPVSVNIPKGGSGSDISLSVTGASIGQIVEIEEVDESGKPKKWKAVDKPGRGGGDNGKTLHLIKTVKFSQPLGEVIEKINFKCFPAATMVHCIGVGSSSASDVRGIVLVIDSSNKNYGETISTFAGKNDTPRYSYAYVINAGGLAVSGMASSTSQSVFDWGGQAPPRAVGGRPLSPGPAHLIINAWQVQSGSLEIYCTEDPME